MTPIDPTDPSWNNQGGDGLTIHQRLAAQFAVAFLTQLDSIVNYEEIAQAGIRQADAFIKVYNERTAAHNQLKS